MQITLSENGEWPPLPPPPSPSPPSRPTPPPTAVLSLRAVRPLRLSALLTQVRCPPPASLPSSDSPSSLIPLPLLACNAVHPPLYSPDPHPSLPCPALPSLPSRISILALLPPLPSHIPPPLPALTPLSSSVVPSFPASLLPHALPLTLLPTFLNPFPLLPPAHLTAFSCPHSSGDRSPPATRRRSPQPGELSSHPQK